MKKAFYTELVKLAEEELEKKERKRVRAAKDFRRLGVCVCVCVCACVCVCFSARSARARAHTHTHARTHAHTQTHTHTHMYIVCMESTLKKNQSVA